MGGPCTDLWGDGDWRQVAESIPHIVWVTDPAGRAIYFNRRGEDYAGAEALAVSWADLVHPEDVERAVAGWRHALRTRTAFEADHRLRRADGAYLWHNSRSQPVLAADGRLVRWVGTSTDVDDRKRIEERLVLAQRDTTATATLLAELQAAAPVGLGFVDRDFRVRRLNQELATLAGVPMADLMRRTLAETVPDVWAQLGSVFRHVLQSGEPVRNLPFTRGDDESGGTHQQWLASFFPIRTGDEVICVGLVVVDVTEQLQAEGFRATVMSQVAEGVYTLDTEGLLTYMNRAASKMLGWTEEELCGRSVHDIVHFQRADGTHVGAADCAIMTEGTGRRLVQLAGETFTRKDGSTFPVAYSSMPLKVGSRVDGVAVVFRDLSDSPRSHNVIRVLVADADPASSDALTAMLAGHEGLEAAGVVTTASAAVEAAQRLRPDVVLVDSDVPDIGGAATARRIKAEAPAASVLLVAVAPNTTVVAAALAAGCVGVVDKQRAWVDVANAVRAAYYGETVISQSDLQQVVDTVRDTWQPTRADDLTGREREVLRCLTQGRSNQQVATHLGLTVNTVRNHVQRVLYKLDVHSRLEAVVLATRMGLLDDEP